MKLTNTFPIYLFCWALLFPFSASYAQTFPFASQGDLRFYIDAAAFQGDEGFVYQEIYYEIPARQLRFVAKGNNDYIAMIEISAHILTQTGDTLATDRLRVEMPAKSEAESQTERSIIQQSAFFLKPGDYSLLVDILDLWNSTTGSAQANFQVSAIPKTLTISDLELALRIQPDTSRVQSMFAKGDLRIYPCASRKFGLFRPDLYLYAELYNLMDDAQPAEIIFTLLNSAGKPAAEPDSLSLKKPGTTCVIQQKFPVSQLATGDYQLQIEIFDGLQQIKAQKSFRIGEPEGLQALVDDLNRQRLLIQYFGDKNDLAHFDRLNPTGKLQFCHDFWRDRDANPATPENEFLLEIVRRVRLAKERFTTPQKTGWETDAGRILIRFGQPDDIETHADASDEAPHEIWSYYEKSRKFWFLTGGADPYRLIHTENEPTETDLSTWQQLIRKIE